MDENIINSNEEDDPPSINNNIDENISISTQYIKKKSKESKIKKTHNLLSADKKVTSNSVKSFKFKKIPKKKAVPIPGNTKPIKPINISKFMYFLFVFIFKSTSNQCIVIGFIMLLLIDQSLTYYFYQFIDNYSSNESINTIIGFTLIMLLINGIGRIIRPLYSDHIGNILQFYILQNTSLITKRTTKDPIKSYNSAELYYIVNKHKKVIEDASCILFFDLILNISSLIREIKILIYTKTAIFTYNIYYIFMIIIGFLIILISKWLIFKIRIKVTKKYCKIERLFVKEVNKILDMKKIIQENLNNDILYIKYKNISELYQIIVDTVFNLFTTFVIALMYFNFIQLFKFQHFNTYVKTFPILYLFKGIIDSIIQLEKERGMIFDKELSLYMK